MRYSQRLTGKDFALEDAPHSTENRYIALVKYHTHKGMWLVTRHQHRPSEHDGHIWLLDPIPEGTRQLPTASSID
jgi:hypothetical protein